MKDSPSPKTRTRPASSGTQARGELVNRVREALDEVTHAAAGDPGISAVASSAATLLQVTREIVLLLVEARRSAGETAPGRVAEYRALLHRVLDASTDRPIRLGMHATPFAAEWTDLLIEAVQVSDFTVGPLFLGRARARGDRTLFLLSPDRREGRISWDEAADTVRRIGRSLLVLRENGTIGPETPVAWLGANSPELALFDLACLVTGTRVVPVPANSPAAQVSFILEDARAGVLFLGDELAAQVALEAIGSDGPQRVHWLDPRAETRGRIQSFDAFLELGESLPDDAVDQAAHAVKSEDIATIMYTSGTTGEPKGVPFTHANLVTKRFARAAAWPDLGEGDVFLCYLPLYHTFGRWLEMLGCVFWGSVYAFVDDVSVESLLHSFQRARPTTFISVPKKWIQMAEAVAPILDDADVDPAKGREIARELVAITGGRLKRGLSAAGYLPPSVFERFHAAGIELHSGFGMTEATGGITMTAAGDYQEDSIGFALPGIDLHIADDGELLIRGPYVTPPADGDPPREDGWFATGDIITKDAIGHLRIVDRKKEIFKNVQGETISPRRVESLFADFDVVERVLLIGDRREYCTVLIVPVASLRGKTSADSPESFTLDDPELREIFAPLVSTVNRFLAPFERILDFALLSRDLDAERGELTAKGTPRRKLLAERFKDAIDPMYSREALSLTVGELHVRVPHWFLRQTGIHSREVRATEEGIEVATTGHVLPIRALEGGHVLVGDLEYDAGGETLLLGEIFGRAELWLGNTSVRDFAGSGIDHWWRRGRRFRVRTRLVRRPPLTDEKAPTGGWATDTGLDVEVLHSLAHGLRNPEVEPRRDVVELLRDTLTGENPEMDRLVRDVLQSGLSDPEIRGECFHALIPGLSPEELDELLQAHLDDPAFPSERNAGLIARAHLRNDQLDVLLERLERLTADVALGWNPERLNRFAGLLVRQAIEHRSSHLRVRSVLARLTEDAEREELRERFRGHLDDLVTGFRERLPIQEPADDVTWEEVVDFADDVEPRDRERILRAFAETPLLTEAKTLLGPATITDVRPLRAGSLRVRFLGTGTGRSVYLMEWRPAGRRNVAAFECILKVNQDLEWEDIQEELRLLVRARSGASGRPVVKTQGGGYRDHGLWTEEYIPGSTLDNLLDRLSISGTDEEGPLTAPGGRLAVVWPFVVSSCASLIVDFWKRTGQRVTLAKPTPQKLVLPPSDWQIGGRLVSIADRVPCERLTDVLLSIHRDILQPLREKYADADLGPEWPLLFSSALEVLGEKEGLERLEREAPWSSDPTEADLPGRTAELQASGERIGPAALRFVSSIRRHGFMPGRLRHAARRYRRWAHLNPNATLEAQAATLDQIENAYGLSELESVRGGSRLQLFRHTVFRGGDTEFARGLDDLIQRATTADSRDEWHADVASLRESFALEAREEFFLARMLYPHVDPRGHAVLVREPGQEGSSAAGVEVERTDSAGEPFRIRRPANPNETSALYRVFRASNFRRFYGGSDHDLLVVTEDRSRVIGGLIYRRTSPTFVVLDWIVVSRRRRGRGVGSILLSEFLERLKAQGVNAVATGFFRPSFFGKFGFGVDPRYAGLVHFLQPDEMGATTPEKPEE